MAAEEEKRPPLQRSRLNKLPELFLLCQASY
jgi:hypothetical protein